MTGFWMFGLLEEVEQSRVEWLCDFHRGKVGCGQNLELAVGDLAVEEVCVGGGTDYVVFARYDERGCGDGGDFVAQVVVA